MANSEWVIEVDEADFESLVLERSHQVPVLVDFWAPWCGPCRTLGPILEKLATEMSGRFLLAKVNADHNIELGKKYRIQGIPAVKLIIEGQPVDEFTGALPERQVRAFLDNAIPSEADQLCDQGADADEVGDSARAMEKYQAALTLEPNHFGAVIGMSGLLVADGKVEEARELMGLLGPAEARDPAAKQLLARLDFQNDAGDMDELWRRVEQNPDDMEARLALGRSLVGLQQHAKGLDQFLEMVARDRTFQDDIGRKEVLRTFDLLGPSHTIVHQYRSKLAAILFA
ncbi:MAG: co-chaperone YbbN [Magnetococcales bacterium]|nr:co-chaperone YbbN [Magnetococcales bacterium]